MSVAEHDLAALEQRLTARRFLDSGILVQPPPPDPESFAGRVLARQRARAAERRAQAEAQAERDRLERVEAERLEAERQARNAPKIAAIREQLDELVLLRGELFARYVADVDEKVEDLERQIRELK
ncbi:MAG: hypothetical protein ACYCWW_10935 [Deltaproteobacteria bacterium]